MNTPPLRRHLQAVEREWATFDAIATMSVAGFDQLLTDMGYRADLADRACDSAPVTLSTEGVLLEAAYDSLESAYREVATERRRVRRMRSELWATRLFAVMLTILMVALMWMLGGR